MARMDLNPDILCDVCGGANTLNLPALPVLTQTLAAESALSTMSKDTERCSYYQMISKASNDLLNFNIAINHTL